MKNAICAALVVAGALLFQVPAAYAAECSGSWQVLPNYKPGSGGVCAAIGLNTNQPTCRRGQRFATYCDDASGGRYRVCQSNVPCGQERHRDRQYNERYRDDRQDYRGERYPDSGDGNRNNW
ncbi:MAG: hypothetical protein WBN83_00775 [Desulfoprunum sp.]|uniref:hypothetical protein n=1 Tax=Desulfoprunum sp. TaxID=2020866 RepID=UPI00052DAADF|nr:hypothetical protein JT06_16600 [Desulfobulbus sp. Tol-SR]